MTTKQCMKKIKTLMEDDRKYLLKECERLLDSGGIEKNDYLQDFALAQIILHVALKNLSEQRRPLHEPHKKDADNLRYF